MRDLPIGDAARCPGVKIPAIRHLEQQDLLAAPPRNDGNRRIFSAKDVARLIFMRHARDRGFAPSAVRGLRQGSRAVTFSPQRHLLSPLVQVFHPVS